MGFSMALRKFGLPKVIGSFWYSMPRADAPAASNSSTARITLRALPIARAPATMKPILLARQMRRVCSAISVKVTKPYSGAPMTANSKFGGAPTPTSNPRSSAIRLEIGSNTCGAYTHRSPASNARNFWRRSVAFIRFPAVAIYPRSFRLQIDPDLCDLVTSGCVLCQEDDRVLYNVTWKGRKRVAGDRFLRLVFLICFLPA